MKEKVNSPPRQRNQSELHLRQLREWHERRNVDIATVEKLAKPYSTYQRKHTTLSYRNRNYVPASRANRRHLIYPVLIAVETCREREGKIPSKNPLKDLGNRKSNDYEH